MSGNVYIKKDINEISISVPSRLTDNSRPKAVQSTEVNYPPPIYETDSGLLAATTRWMAVITPTYWIVYHPDLSPDPPSEPESIPTPTADEEKDGEIQNN